ncbi:MAG: hypothetical protein KF708_12670 [Pirellulales bacterium]|nr:hypothetical protein [Pirellulales bacterium]
MRQLARQFLLLLGLLVCLSPISDAEEESTAAVNVLVTGDQYTIRVERNGTSESYTGVLVQVRPDWIVLQREEAGRHEGVPMSQRPFFHRTFKNVGIGREESIVWLPREAATIVQRVRPHEQTPLRHVTDREPPAEQFCHVDYAEGGELKLLKGTLTHDDGTDLRIVSESLVPEQKRMPLLGDIPLVGRAFQRQIFVPQHREQKLAREDVLAVRVKAE